jgi:hypothetical protein
MIHEAVQNLFVSDQTQHHASDINTLTELLINNSTSARTELESLPMAAEKKAAMLRLVK